MKPQVSSCECGWNEHIVSYGFFRVWIQKETQAKLPSFFFKLFTHPYVSFTYALNQSLIIRKTYRFCKMLCFYSLLITVKQIIILLLILSLLFNYYLLKSMDMKNK